MPRGAFCFALIMMPPFGRFINHVIQPRTGKEAIWIDTSGIVAMMQNLLPIRYGAFYKLKGQSMCCNYFAAVVKSAIAFGYRGTAPNPTAANLLNVCPKVN